MKKFYSCAADSNLGKALRDILDKCNSADKAADTLAKNGVHCDILFLDPPYADVSRYWEAAEAFIQKKIIKNDGIILIEHEKSVIMPLAISCFTQTKSKRYGITRITYYERGE